MIGDQGLLKSTLFRELAGDDWFTDHLSDLGNKDSRIELLGRWIVELSELANIRSGKDVGEIKSFLVCRSDKFRPPYGRITEAIPRQNVFCGTTNDSTFLNDPTGGRRFWPVDVNKVDLDAIREYRNQLWAEALHQFRTGAPWWLETTELNQLATDEQEARYEEGPRDAIIRDWIDRPHPRMKAYQEETELPWNDSRVGRINGQDVAIHAFGIPVAQIKQGDSKEIARCLKHLKYKEIQETTGKRRRYWVSPVPPNYLGGCK